MSMTLEDLLAELRAIAPENLQEGWDNCGLQINLGAESIERILLCLEITDAVIDEACEKGADLIVTHHPLLFRGIKQVSAGDVTGRYLIRLIQNGISVYSSHTAFDTVDGGNNDYLAELLGLQDIRRMATETDPSGGSSMPRTGLLKQPLTVEAVCTHISKVLELPAGSLRASGDPAAIIQKIGLCTGAGGDFLLDAKKAGCDLFLTGDVKYHEAQLAKEIGLCVVDAGHYDTEKIFSENVANQLRERVGKKIEIFESKVNANPYTFMV